MKLLEHGVDLKLYKSLHVLIPYAGLNYETEEIVYRWPKTFSHGNWTEENAQWIAGDDFAGYSFEGNKDVGIRRLHITSHNFDEPSLLKGLQRAQTVLTIHG